MNETLLKLALPGVLFVFATGIIVQALQISGPLAESNAHIYPLVVAGLLALGSLASMVGAVREHRRPVEQGSAGLAEAPAELQSATSSDDAVLTAQATEVEADTGARTRILAVLGASVAYPALMPLLGFHLTTVLYAAMLSLLLQERSAKGIALSLATGVGITVFCHVVFIEVLNARLPSGVVF